MPNGGGGLPTCPEGEATSLRHLLSSKWLYWGGGDSALPTLVAPALPCCVGLGAPLGQGSP